MHAMLEAASGTGAILLMMAGLWVVLGPRALWTRWFRLERRWRERRFAGDWTHLEQATGRRGYFWVPRDLAIESPQDVYAYALSDVFWRSKFSWLVRAFCWYGGAMLVVLGFLVLSFGP